MQVDCGQTRALQAMRSSPADSVAGPLPHVSRHVIEPVAIRAVLCNRCDAGKSIGCVVSIGEVSLMCVGHPVVVLRKSVAPHKWFAGKTTSGCKF